VQVMAPLPVIGTAGLAKFTAVYLGAQALAQAGRLHLTGRACCGALTAVLCLVLFRVFDDLKDFDADSRLAAGGDPRYRDRPTVRGSIDAADLKWLRNLLLVVLVGINAPLGFPLPFAVFALALTVTWLSSKWYFCPAIAKSLLLALVTHSPLTLLLGAYIVAIVVHETSLPTLSVTLIPLLLGTWFPLVAWETSRKIRVPEDETDYETYSKIFGFRRAPAVPLFFVLAATLCLALVTITSGAPRWTAAVFAGAAVPFVLAVLRFWWRSNRQNACLQPFAEIFALASDLGLAAILVVTRGLAWW
jgi:hypothetical protein